MIKNYLEGISPLIEKAKMVRNHARSAGRSFSFHFAGARPRGIIVLLVMVLATNFVGLVFPEQNQTNLFTRIYFFQFQAQAGKTAQFDMFDQE
jgi:hypothetical protein